VNKVAAVILTYNEEKHIKRCIDSIRNHVDFILIVDSFSTDDTQKIAQNLNVKFVQNPWINYSNQFNFGLELLNNQYDWILRIDSDEYFNASSSVNLKSFLQLNNNVSGFSIFRYMKFMGKPIKYGGVYPNKVVRIFKSEKGKCENSWMDEHIIVEGEVKFNKFFNIVDDNLNSVSWWIDKHNSYANREAVDLLLRKNSVNDGNKFTLSKSAKLKRYFKVKIYANFSPQFRSYLYFIYRFIILLGFLDSKEGRIYHFLQGLWYRRLVDIKILEVRNYQDKTHYNIQRSILDVLGIDLSKIAR
jgi:glycosyltransferase involved in cell wall biosynthesis